jgi:hypothetical protein
MIVHAGSVKPTSQPSKNGAKLAELCLFQPVQVTSPFARAAKDCANT